VGDDVAVEAIGDVFGQARATAGIHRDAIAAFCVGMPGIGMPAHRESMIEALAAIEMPNLLLCTDGEIAHKGALGGLVGFTVSSGTGSIVWGTDYYGRPKRAGGYGRHIGDPGSGSQISQEAVQAVLKEIDRELPPSELSKQIYRYFDIRNPGDFRAKFFTPDGGAAEIPSALSERVAVAANEHHDLSAIRILRKAGKDLGDMVLDAVYARRMQSSRFRVAFIGGGFKAGRILIEQFRKTVRNGARYAEIGPPLFPPTVGAAMIALDNLRDSRRVA